MTKQYRVPVPWRSLLILWFLAVCANAIGAQEFKGLETHMTPEELEAAGIPKLNTRERQRLNQWIADYIAGKPESHEARDNDVSGTGNPSPSSETDEPSRVSGADEIVARVAAFDGWSGNTIFKLDNGQVWKQRHPGQYSYSGDDTEVVIKKNFFGFYELHHPASGRSIGVKQLR